MVYFLSVEIFNQKGISEMNIPKIFVLLLSSVFVLSSCSSTPTSQSMGKYFGTALIVGGASYFLVDTDNKTDAEKKELTSNKKTGYGLLAAGFLIHYLMNKTKESKKKEIQKKNARL